MSDLLLGIDVGTSNIKAALVTADGRVVAHAQESYPTQVLSSGGVEQNPADWWAGVCTVTRRVLAQSAARPEQVRAIGISGQGCAVTLIDPQGRVIRPAIIWMDSRAEPQCEQLRRCCAEQIFSVNGKSPAPYNSDPSLMWLAEHEPQSITDAQCSLTSTGYINYRLTGEAVMNRSDASILFAFDLAANSWTDDLIESFGLPRKLYPRVARCSDVIGALRAEPAADMGLLPGIPVVAGGEDTSAAGLAIGVVRPGQTLLSLGTAGTIYAVQANVALHPQLLAFLHVLDDCVLLGGSMIAVGAGLHWFRQILGGTADYDVLTALASHATPGSLIFLPYLNGELQPINDGNARGVFFGLGLHTTQADMVRAVMEGAAFAIAHNLRLAAQVGTPISEIRAVGGPTRSPLWCQIIADVTGQPLTVLGDNPGAPLGDALLAGAGIGLIDDLTGTAQRVAQIDRIYEPRPALHQQYAEVFQIYEHLYPALKAEFAALLKLSPSRQYRPPIE